jgi:hypothetical protein
MEAATTRTAQEIFFNSMMQNARVMLAAVEMKKGF